MGALHSLIRESQGMPKEERSWGQGRAKDLLFHFSFTIWPTSNNAYSMSTIPKCSHLYDASKPCRTTDHPTEDIPGKQQANPSLEPGSPIARLVLVVSLQLRCRVEPGQVLFTRGFLSIFTEAMSSQKPPPATPPWRWIPQTWIKSLGSIQFTPLSALVCKSRPSQPEWLCSSELTVSGWQFWDSEMAGQLLPETQMSSLLMPDSPGLGVALVAFAL